MNVFNTRFDIFVRDLDAGDFLEDFFIAAVVSIVIVRLFLYLTGYPQLGGTYFHIAHMLYGGIIMLISIGILLTFIDREAKQFASILGGVGFGLFIDELGKFITRDNNYFFQPTVAMLYVFFLLLFLLIRSISSIIPVNKQGYAVNAVEVMKELMLHDMDIYEKRKALQYLKKANVQDEHVALLIELLKRAPVRKKSKEDLFTTVRSKMAVFYHAFIDRKYFPEIIILLFALQVTWSFATSLTSVYDELTFLNTGLVASIAVSVLCIVIGAYLILRRNRFQAYQYFKYSTLISIFFTQFFLFYQEQLSAIFQLTWSVIVYVIVRVLITEEEQLRRERAVA